MNDSENENPYAGPSNDSTEDGSASLVPTWFWIVGGIAILWNLMGLMAFGVEMITVSNPEAMSALPEDQQALYKLVPSWVTIAFAIAVIAGTLGSIGLLMRKKWAMPVLVLSLLGVVGQQAYMFFLSDTFKVMGSAAMVLPLLVLVIAILLIYFSHLATKRGWLR